MRSEDARIRLLLKLHKRNWTELNGTNIKKAMRSRIKGGAEEPEVFTSFDAEIFAYNVQIDPVHNSFNTTKEDELLGKWHYIYHSKESQAHVKLAGKGRDINPLIVLPSVLSSWRHPQDTYDIDKISEKYNYNNTWKVVDISSQLELDKLELSSYKTTLEWIPEVPRFTKELKTQCTSLRDKYKKILEKNRAIQKKAVYSILSKSVTEYTQKWVRWITSDPHTLQDYSAKVEKMWEDKDISDEFLFNNLGNLTIPDATRDNLMNFYSSIDFQLLKKLVATSTDSNPVQYDYQWANDYKIDDEIIGKFEKIYPMTRDGDGLIDILMRQYDELNDCTSKNINLFEKKEDLDKICIEIKDLISSINPDKGTSDINTSDKSAKAFIERIVHSPTIEDLELIQSKGIWKRSGANLLNEYPVLLQSWRSTLTQWFNNKKRVPEMPIENQTKFGLDNSERAKLVKEWWTYHAKRCYNFILQDSNKCTPEAQKEVLDNASSSIKDITFDEAVELGYNNRGDAKLRYPKDVLNDYIVQNKCPPAIPENQDEFFKKLAEEDYKIMGGTPEKVIENWRKFDLEYGNKWNKLDEDNLPPITISRELFLYYVASTTGVLGLYEYYVEERDGDTSANSYAIKWKVQRIWGPHWDDIINGDLAPWDDAISQARIALINSLINIGALPPDIYEDYISSAKSIAVQNFVDSVGELSVAMKGYLSGRSWVPESIYNAIPQEFKDNIVFTWRPGDSLKTGDPFIDDWLLSDIANKAYTEFIKKTVEKVVDDIWKVIIPESIPIAKRTFLTVEKRAELLAIKESLAESARGWQNFFDKDAWGVAGAISTMFLEVGIQFFPTTANRKVSTLQKWLNVAKSGFEFLVTKITGKLYQEFTRRFLERAIRDVYAKQWDQFETIATYRVPYPELPPDLKDIAEYAQKLGDAMTKLTKSGVLDPEKIRLVEINRTNLLSLSGDANKVDSYMNYLRQINASKFVQKNWDIEDSRLFEQIAKEMQADSKIEKYTDYMKACWNSQKQQFNRKLMLERRVSRLKTAQSGTYVAEEEELLAEAEGIVADWEIGSVFSLAKYGIPLEVAIIGLALVIYIIWDMAQSKANWNDSFTKQIPGIVMTMIETNYYWWLDTYYDVKHQFEQFWKSLSNWGITREEYITEEQKLEKELTEADEIKQMLSSSPENFEYSNEFNVYYKSNPTKSNFDYQYNQFKEKREIMEEVYAKFLSINGLPCTYWDEDTEREKTNPEPCMTLEEENIYRNDIQEEYKRWKYWKNRASEFNTFVPEEGVPAPTFPPQPFEPKPRPPPTHPQPPLEITDDDIQKFLVPSEDNWKLSSFYDSKVQLEKKHPNENFDNMYRKQFDAAMKRWNEMYPRYKALSEDERKLNKNDTIVMNYRQIIQEARVWKKKILEQQEKDKNTQQNPPPSQPPPPSDQPAPFQGSGVGGRIKCRLYKMNAKGGASTALLTLTDTPGAPGAPGGAPGAPGAPISGRTISTSGQSAARRTDETVGSVKATIEAFQGLKNPKKAVVQDLASDLLDFYNTASPEARGALDDSFNIDGFINRLSKGANMTGKKAQKYFKDMSEAIGDMMLPVEKPYDEEADTGRADLVGLGMSGGCDCGGAEPKSSMPKLNFTKVVPSEPMPSEEKKLLTKGGIRPDFIDRLRRAVRRSMKGRGNAGNPLQAYQQEGGLERGKAENAADYEWNRVMEKARRFQRKDLNVSNARKLVDEPYYNTSYYNTLRTPNSAFGEWHGNGKKKSRRVYGDTPEEKEDEFYDEFKRRYTHELYPRRDETIASRALVDMGEEMGGQPSRIANTMADMSQDIYGRDAERLRKYNRMAAESGVPNRTLYNVKDGHGRIVYKTRNLNDAQSKLLEVLQLELAMAKPEQGNKRIIDNQVRVMPEIVPTNLLPTQWLHSED
jgi:hypothetical protein